MKIAFIGAGNIAEASICGLRQKGLVKARNIVAADIKEKRRQYIRSKYRVRTTSNNKEAVKQAEVIFLTVKPQKIEEVLRPLKKVFNSRQLLVSVAAGITTSFIQTRIAAKVPLIRAMPNTPALVGEGMTALYQGIYAKKKHFLLAKKMFQAVGKVVEIKKESLLNDITALSGSGPAYFFLLIEILAQAGVKMGLAKGLAKQLVRQTASGSIKMLTQTGEEPETLREKVTSPRGTTQAAIEYLKKKNFSRILTEAVKEAKKRSQELSQ